MSHPHRLLLAAAILAAACGTPTTQPVPADADAVGGGPIKFKTGEISAQSPGCNEPGTRCAGVRLSFPITTGGGTVSVRDNIDLFLTHDLVSRMRGFLPEDVGSSIGNLEGLAGAFLAEHRAFVGEFPDATAEWTIEIEAAAVYNTPMVTTIEISEFAFTGGAHPNSRRRLASFDVATGQLLGVEDISADIDGLSSLAEHNLRADRGLGPDDDLEAAGFWFPEEGFTLPDNLGVVADGLVFHWDAYDIAPYSMGPIDLLVPAADIRPIAGRDYW